MNKLSKFSRAIVAIAMMLVVALPSLAHDFDVDGIYYNYLDKTAKTVEITYKGRSYSSYSNEYTGSITIPSSVTYSGTTYSVTSIGSSAFDNCSGLTEITIPNSVTEIGSYAFDNCSGLTEITIPNSVTKIGNGTFNNCSGLTEITIPNSVTEIGSYAFNNTAWYNNQADGVIYINNVLYKYKGTVPDNTSINIKEGAVSISSYAFEYCSGLTEITIPNSVTEIGSKAFAYCTSLTSIIVKNDNNKYDSRNNCNAIIETSTNKLIAGCKNTIIPNSVTEIGSYAFYGCDGLTSVTIPNSVTSIGSYAFYGCDGLTSVTIPNSVTEIGQSAFEYCSGLTEITIPNSVTSIGQSAFYDCDGLTSVSIPNSVTEIGYSAFGHCSGLTSVTIPNSVTEIGSSAFMNCSGLTEITIPNSVTEIGSYAFNNCSGLTEITIPNSVTEIGSYAFNNTAWYNNQADGVIYINNVLYKYKGTMPDNTSINIKEGTVSISSYAFEYCSGLTEITIPNSVTEIGDGAFYNSSGLKTIVSLNPTPPTCGSSNSFKNYTKATLYVPKDSFAKYFVDKVWGQFSNIKKIETLVSSITLNETIITIKPECNYMLNATALPSNATIPNLTWESDNPTVATVDQNGKVTGVSDGTATIIVKANDGSNVSTTCMVIVNSSATPSITLSQTEATLLVNDIMTVSYSIGNSLTKAATWSTSDANIAYVKPNSDGSATIVGMAYGVATITATLVDNGKEYSASCKVTVVDVSGIESVEADNNAVEVARYDIHGRLLSEPAPGINIVKYSDGTTRKEIVK